MITIKNQQEQVYAAQDRVDLGRTFGSIEEVQEFLDGLRDTWWWQRWYWRIARVEVYASDRAMSTRHAGVARWDERKNAGLIVLRKSGMRERIVVHELAHVVACALHNSTGHDPIFCRDFANLVYLIMGSKPWLDLQRGFNAEKVEY